MKENERYQAQVEFSPEADLSDKQKAELSQLGGAVGNLLGIISTMYMRISFLDARLRALEEMYEVSDKDRACPN